MFKSNDKGSFKELTFTYTIPKINREIIRISTRTLLRNKSWLCINNVFHNLLRSLLLYNFC